jgi:hypothetical protein
MHVTGEVSPPSRTKVGGLVWADRDDEEGRTSPHLDTLRS